MNTILSNSKPKSRSKTVSLILCAFFAALTGICSGISIPLPFTPIPINLATLAVFLAGGLLGWKWGSLSQIVYVFLGAVGVPVFHGFTAGFGILVGPTGGYIAGYIAAAFLVGLIVEKATITKSTVYFKTILAMIIGLFACYLLGTLWFMYLTKTGFIAAAMSCIVPFLLGDAVKIVAGSLLINRLKRYL